MYSTHTLWITYSHCVGFLRYGITNQPFTAHIITAWYIACICQLQPLASSLAFQLIKHSSAWILKTPATYVPLQVVSSRPSSCFSLLPWTERTLYCFMQSFGRRPLPTVYLTSGLRSQVLPLSNSRRLCRTKRTDSFGSFFVFSARFFSTCDL